jgi:hypothetical protein
VSLTLKAGRLDQDPLVLLRDDSKLPGMLMRQPDAVCQVAGIRTRPVHQEVESFQRETFMTRLLLLILALSLTGCMSGALKAPARPAAVPAAAVVTSKSYPGVTLWYPASWGNIETGAGNAMRYYSSLFCAKCYQGK